MTTMSSSAAGGNPPLFLHLATLFILYLLTTSKVAATATSSTHPKLRHHRHLQSDTQFCGRTWGDAIDNCSPTTHCPNGNDDCADNETCHGYLPGCNINDLLQSQPSSNNDSNNNGGTPATAPTPPPIRNEYDERNMKFCGSTWNEANDSCSLRTWCPSGNECDESSGQICWGGIPACNAYYLLLEGDNDEEGEESNLGGEDESIIVVEPPPTELIIQCSAEVYQCPSSGLFVARAPELNCEFYPCPVPPPNPSTNAPSVAPQKINTENVDVVPDDVTTTDLEETTMAPTMKPIWVDNDAGEEEANENNNNESNNSSGGEEELTTTSNNLWCGETRFDAIRNCGRKGYDCPNGYCLQDLICFMVSNQCEGGGDSSSGGDNDSSSSNEAAAGEATGDVSDTYFCGVTHTDAVSSCHERCRSGSSAECSSGETCFQNVYECAVEIPLPPPSDLSITPPPTLYPSTLGMMTMTEAPSPSSNPTDNTLVTISPTFGADNDAVVQPPNLPELYCASSMDELEVSCSTAKECFSEPCPLGQMCYPYECKGNSDSVTTSTQPTTTIIPTYSPTPTAEKISLPDDTTTTTTTNEEEAQFFCASTFEELETTCSTTAQSCSIFGRDECPPGQWCYEYACNTLTNDAPESSNPELNGGMDEQPPQQQIETSYCASSIDQLNERCGLALPCTTDNDCDVDGDFCLKFDCHQNLMQCPLNFVGWHSSKDCKQYYYCEQGVAGSSKMCDEGMKFDKTRDECTTDYVNEFCYGLAENDSGSGSIVQPGTAYKELCPPGFTGWHSSDGECNEYQKCAAGTPGPTRVCGFGLKFDKTRGECIDAALVNINLCEGPLPQGNLCPSASFTGWIARKDCTEYFYCEIGKADFVNTCPGGLLFDTQSGICKPADAVNCGGNGNEMPPQNPSLPSNNNNNVVDTGGSNNSNTSPPPAPDFFDWSNTPPPTAPQNDSKIPPWMFKKDPNGGTVRSTTLQVGLFTVVLISWMLF
jgi:hypothetical protein